MYIFRLWLDWTSVWNAGVSKRGSICIYCVSKGVPRPSLLSRSEEGASRAPSSCSGTRLWPFHVDDWFGCSEEGEEGSGFGLCPLITLYYHTGGIYHQTPKASVQGEHWNQSPRLHAIHPGPRKAALSSASTSIFSVRGGCSREKVGGKEQRGKEGFEVRGKSLESPLCLVFFFFFSFHFIQCCSLLWCWCHSMDFKHPASPRASNNVNKPPTNVASKAIRCLAGWRYIGMLNKLQLFLPDECVPSVQLCQHIWGTSTRGPKHSAAGGRTQP